MPVRAFAFPLALTLAAAAVGAPASDEAPVVPPGQQRGEKAKGGGKLRYWPARPDQAVVLAATFLGGKGHEFLVDGGFQPDGTVVLVGNVMGVPLELGVPETVLGKDDARPAEVTFGPQLNDRGKPETRDGKPVMEKPSWRHPAATGVVIRCSSDLKRVLSVARMPWGSGAITSAEVGADGAITIAGRASAGIARLGGNQATYQAKPAKGKGTCEATFVARLTPDAAKVEWVRLGSGASHAPRLTAGKDGAVVLSAQDIRTIDASGGSRAAVALEQVPSEEVSVSPLDGTIVRGGEHHWHTGREPYRCPTLRTYLPDGTLQYQLYDWGGNYVVLDNNRLVSDTAVRMVSHDPAGNVVAVLWSDGGNSVAARLPTDVRQGVGMRGVGLTTAGANATSFAYLVRMDPENYQVNGWTLWCTQYAGKANGASIQVVNQAGDGSVCFAGGAAWGLLQTPNRLARGEPAGHYVAVLTPDLSGVRFSSTVPGAGAAMIGDDTSWNIASGTVGGRSRVLFLSGAAASAEVYGLTTDTPTVSALQPGFGGGASDGYVIMLDLGTPAPAPAAAPRPAPRLSIANEGRRVSKKQGDGGAPVGKDGQVFRFSPDHPRFNTVDAEFRVVDGSAWPNFAVGKPVSGEITWSGGKPSGSFSVECPTWCQPKGDQSRRVLGDLMKGDTPPKLGFTIESLGAFTSRSVESPERDGKTSTRIIDSCPAKAVLTIGSHSLKVDAECAVKTGQVVEKEWQKTTVSAYFTVRGRDLGLGGDLAGKDIEVRISAYGLAGGPPAKKK